MIKGGSIRAPAVNCGLYGLRPSSYRAPLMGITAPNVGSEQILPVVGPQSTTLEGIKIFMKIVIGAKPWIVEPSLLPLPWRDTESYLNQRGAKKLTVGIMWSDGIVNPQPPITRALKEVAEKLGATPEIEVVDWQPWKHDFASEILVSPIYLTACTYACGDQARLKNTLGPSIFPRRRESNLGNIERIG